MQKVTSNQENAYNTFAKVRAMMQDVTGKKPREIL